MNRKIFYTFIIFLIGIIITGIVLYFCLNKSSSTSIIYKGAIVTNGIGCATIGKNILEKGGSAVDATIAALFCEGAALPQSMGLGGGFLMTIYIKENNTVYSLNSREMAPSAATTDMFKGDSLLSERGGLAVAVPGELRGYWWAWKRFGKLPWAELIQPTINLCRNGLVVTSFLETVFEQTKTRLLADPGLRSVFIDSKTNKPFKTGQKIKMLKLADTLEIIAKEGGDAIHNGSLTNALVEDIQANGGIITVEDLNNYSPEWQEPITVNLPNNLVLYTAPFPGSGTLLSFILNILKDYLDITNPESMTNYQRIIESFKFAYGKRTQMGDPNFNDIDDLFQNLTSESYAKEIRKKISDVSTSQDPTYYGAVTDGIEDHGTAHICVLAGNGDAVSVTSTVNLYFGAAFMSEQTGIILNDQMDDFSSPDLNSSYSIPPSEANFIEAGKRPLSSMSPTIVVNKKTNNVKLVVGAAGGTKITTSIALSLIRYLWYGWSIDKAINDGRFHHQLFPMRVQLEQFYLNNTEFLKGLEKLGHKYELDSIDGFSSLTAIATQNLLGTVDRRRYGEIVYV